MPLGGAEGMYRGHGMRRALISQQHHWKLEGNVLVCSDLEGKLFQMQYAVYCYF